MNAPEMRPRHRYRCRTCGGPAHRDTNVAAPIGHEDTRKPLLHLNREDWIDNPHDVDPIDLGEAPR